MLTSYITRPEATPIKLKPGSLTLGRASDNDVALNHNSVSGHHARIVTYFEVSYIEDLNSTNGTFLNGKRIQQHTLHDGDEIRMGAVRLIFHRQAPPEEQGASPADSTQAVG